MAASFEPGVTKVWRLAGHNQIEQLRLPGWNFQPLKGVGQEILDAGRLWQTGQLQLSHETKASIAGTSNRGQTPIGVTALGILISERGAPRFWGREMGPCDIPIGLSGTEYEVVMPPSVSLLRMAVAEEVWLEHAGAAWGPERAALRPYGTMTIRSMVHRDFIVRAWSRLTEFGLHRSQHLRDVAIARLLEDELLEHLFACISVEPVSKISAIRPQRRLVLRRALEYLDAHIHEPVRLTDLCREVGTCKRTLEVAFKECLDMTPKTYLHLCRLRSARRDLLALGPSDTTVTEIAIRWGLFHLSRFAQDYRKIFGELPRETLHNRSRRDCISVQPISATQPAASISE